VRALMTSLVDDSSDVISFLSPAGRILCTSVSSGKLFGYLPAEIVGRNAFDLIHPDDRHQSRRARAAILAKPSCPRRLDVRVRRKDGGWCWVESTVSNLLDEPRFGAIVVNCRQIGESRQAREQAQKETDELIRSNARLEDFAYAVAHDLREPLRTISMFTELLLDESDLDASGRQKAHFIVDGIKRMSALFEGLHGFAVRGFDDPAQPLDLTRIVADVLQNLGHAIKVNGAGVTVDRLPKVLGNEQHLLRVFQNLIANAIKYRSERPIEIHITAEQLGQEWIIKIQDNGLGIAEEHQERIFGLFKRLHGPETPGAGIGLAICRKIVEAMGGAIWVESKSGTGSTFCFTVPVVADAGMRPWSNGGGMHDLETTAADGDESESGLDLPGKAARLTFHAPG